MEERGGRRLDVALAFSFGLLTVLLRLPYRLGVPYNWDAVQFALALKEFDVTKHQPHPPGYLLYVLLGRLLNGWVQDSAQTYVILAVLMSGMTTLVVYLLARALYDRPTALTAAALLTVSPLFWFYGVVGLSYAAEALMASAVAYFTYQALLGRERYIYLSAIYLGLAGGVRQSVIMLLFPLWLGSLAWGTRSARKIIVALGLLGLAVLTWFLPMIWLTGGLDRYLSASAELFSSTVAKTSVFNEGSWEVAFVQLRYLLESTLVGLGFLFLGLLGLPLYWRRHGWSRPEWFLLIWMLPAIVFYSLVHFGRAGYVLTYLPALMILLSRVLVVSVEAVTQTVETPRIRWAVMGAVVGTLVLTNGAFFVSAKPTPREFKRERSDSRVGEWMDRARADYQDMFESRTAAALREHEAVIRTYVETIRELYDPRETALVTEVGNPRSYTWLRHAMFYLSEYPIYQLRVGTPPLHYYAPQSAVTMIPTESSTITLAPRTRQLVWFVDSWNPLAERPRGLQEISLPYGRSLYVLPVGRKPLHYAGYTFAREKPARRVSRSAR